MAKNSSFLKSFILIFSGIILGGLICVFGVFILVLSVSATPVAVKDNSWLVLDFAGEIKEKPLPEIPSIFDIKQRHIELLKYLKAIEYASYDKRIVGILINGDLTFYGKAHTEEIINQLKKFKERGKKIKAWFSYAENKNYYLCSVADTIYMPDTKSASLTLKGYYLTQPYLKDGLDKVGVEFDVIHIGNYKGTGENLTRNSMSNDLKSSYMNFLDSIYDISINDIAKERKIDINKLENLLASGKAIMLTPDQALELKLIDKKSTYEELKNEISFNSFESVSIYNYSSLLEKKVRDNKIAIIYAEGTIYNYFSGEDSFNGEIVGAKSFIEDIEKIKKDNTIKAVILRVNSPGGSALASELMFQSIMSLRKFKPVYVSMGAIAASGGYYISSAGEKIFVDPSTLTGSIGVVSVLMNHKALTDKIGVNFETIKKHKYDDLFTTTRKTSDDEKEIMRSSMLNIYEEFTGHVKKERKITDAEISSLAEGRIWTGEQAVKNKLADYIGGLEDTIQFAIKTNNIKNYTIESFPKPKSFFDALTDGNNVKASNLILKEYAKDENVKQLIDLYFYTLDSKNQSSLIIPFYNLP